MHQTVGSVSSTARLAVKHRPVISALKGGSREVRSSRSATIKLETRQGYMKPCWGGQVGRETETLRRVSLIRACYGEEN